MQYDSYLVVWVFMLLYFCQFDIELSFQSFLSSCCHVHTKTSQFKGVKLIYIRFMEPYTNTRMSTISQRHFQIILKYVAAYYSFIYLNFPQYLIVCVIKLSLLLCGCKCLSLTLLGTLLNVDAQQVNSKQYVLYRNNSFFDLLIKWL